MEPPLAPRTVFFVLLPLARSDARTWAIERKDVREEQGGWRLRLSLIPQQLEPNDRALGVALPFPLGGAMSPWKGRQVSAELPGNSAKECTTRHQDVAPIDNAPNRLAGVPRMA